MANRYWVGGTAAWDGTAGSKWALTSGGAGGQAVPTSADDVFFSSLSTGTCTISAGNTGAKSITCTGFTATLAGSAAISVSGSVLLVAGMTYTYTGTMSILATGTITSAGKSFGSVTVNGSGITVTLGSALTLGITNTFTLTQGTVDLNAFTLSAGIFSSTNTNTRAITFGSANIALTSTTAATTILNMADATNFTYTGTGGFTRNMAATATVVFGTTAGSTTNAPNINFNAGASALTITANSWFNNLIFDSTSTSTVTASAVNITGNLTLDSGGTYTALVPTFQDTGTVTSSGKTLGNTTVNGSGITVTLGDAMTVDIASTFTLTQGTVNLNGFTLSTGAFSSNNTNTRVITFGSANIALTSTSGSTIILNMDDATNFTYTGTGGFTRNMAATATIDFGNTAGGTSTNAPNLTVNAGASALTITATSHFKTIDFTGSTSTVTGTATLYSSPTLAVGGTYTGLSFVYTTTQSFNSGAKSIGGLTVNGSAITLTLAANLTVAVTGTFTLTQGTLDLGGFSLSTGIFSSSNTNTRAITFGSTNITLTGANVTRLSMADATNFTYTGTGGFIVNVNSDITLTFGTTGGSSTNAPNLVANSAGVSDTLTFTATSHFKTIDFTGADCDTLGAVIVYGNVTFDPAGTYTAGFTVTFSGTGTFDSQGQTISFLNINGSGIVVTCADAITVGGTLTFTDGTLRLRRSQTTTVGSFVTSGTTLKYLESTTSGTQATLSDAAGTNTVTYLSIKDSNATGGATFNAISPTNVNAGNNAGWIFGGSGFLMFF
jgi:hypothetical protein